MGKKDGRWAIEVNEVGPKVVQPLKPTVHNVITSNPLNTAKPKSVCLEAAHSQCLKSAFKLSKMPSSVVVSSQQASFGRDPDPPRWFRFKICHYHRTCTSVSCLTICTSLVSSSVPRHGKIGQNFLTRSV